MLAAMAFWSAPRFWLVLVASVALFISAAKSHGRQVRLERELEGHTQVTFGAPNHPWVEALWRKDRVRFWSAYPAVLALALGYGLAARRAGLPLPFPGAAPGARAWGLVLLIGLLWAPVVAFVTAGMFSLVRLNGALGQSSAEKVGLATRAEWAATAMQGSAGWWALTLALAIAVAVLAAREAGARGLAR